MEKLTGIIDSFKGIIEDIIAMFTDFVKKMREFGDNN